MNFQRQHSKPEVQAPTSNVTYLAILSILRAYSMFVYRVKFDEIRAVDCEIYEQITSLTLTLTLKPNPNPNGSSFSRAI